MALTLNLPEEEPEDCIACGQQGDEEYFKHPSISSTDLRVLQKKGLKNFLYYKSPIGKLALKEDNDNFRLGSIIHSFILTPDLFHTIYAFINGKVPNSYQSKKFCDLCSKGVDKVDAYKKSYKTGGDKEANEKYKDYYEYINKISHNPNSIIITKDEYDLAKRLKISHDSYSPLKMFDGYRHYEELELYFDEPIYDYERYYADIDSMEDVDFSNEESYRPISLSDYIIGTVSCKAKADKIVIDDENKICYLIDYKTTYNSENEFLDSFEKWGYAMQAVHYISAINHSRKKLQIGDDYEIKSYILALQKGEPFCANLYEFDWRKAGNTSMMRNSLLNILLNKDNMEDTIRMLHE